MSNNTKCQKECDDCVYYEGKYLAPCHNCYSYQEFKEKLTNADRIRSMSDEELAEFLLKVNTSYSEPCMIDGGDCKWEDYPTHDKGCKDCFLEYLKSEAE